MGAAAAVNTDADVAGRLRGARSRRTRAQTAPLVPVSVMADVPAPAVAGGNSAKMRKGWDPASWRRCSCWLLGRAARGSQG
jgi:hypothetical protein